jgi:hypothetical protein
LKVIPELYAGALRPHSTSRVQQQQQQQQQQPQSQRSNESLVDARPVQTILDRIRGGHCISVPPFLRPIEEEDSTLWSDECCRSEVGVNLRDVPFLCENKTDDFIKALPVDRPPNGKRQTIHIIGLIIVTRRILHEKYFFNRFASRRI